MQIQSWRDDDVEVIVFTKPDCVQANGTFKALDRLEINYEVIDITEDVKAHNLILSEGYLQAPVVVVARQNRPDQTWSGFRPDRIKQIKDPGALYDVA